MSSQENPCSGYVMPWDDLKVIIPAHYWTELERYIDDYDWGKMTERVGECLPKGVATPSGFFMLGDEDTTDGEVELGVVYAYYDVSDLYIMALNPEAAVMQHLLGKLPTPQSWTVWG